MKIRVGIIGFGQFGRLATLHLNKYATVKAFDIKGGDHESLSSLEEVCASDIILFAVPAQNFESACQMVLPHINKKTLIADVSSVKIRPLETLKNYFPENEILGTHPIFGPQSGKHGLLNLPLVLTNVSWTPEHYLQVKSFLSHELGLHIIEKTPEEHDREMAQVQGLAHFIGRALSELRVTEYETSTMSYRHLLELRDLLQEDSWELFKTIENENPYASEVRRNFLEALTSLEARLATP
jgi:prephenate dehydrogenase